MILLLDTHAFLWFAWDDPNLSLNAKALIEDPANRKLVSVASCWEIAIKAGLKKLILGEPAATFLPRELAANGFGLLDIELAHATIVEVLPRHHKGTRSTVCWWLKQLSRSSRLSVPMVFWTSMEFTACGKRLHLPRGIAHLAALKSIRSILDLMRLSTEPGY